MASSGNFAVFNPLANTTAGLSYSGAVYSNGNTRFRGNTGGTATTQLTHALSSGKWYIEFYIDGSPAGGFPMIGIVASGINSSTLQNTSNASALTITSDLQTVNGDKRVFGSTSGTSYGSGFSDGDICQMAIDIDNGKVWWGKNNTFFGSGDPANGTNAGDTFTGGTEMMVFVGSYSGAAYTIVNAGQDDTFGGNETAAGNADGNGFGVFKYSPPTGFLSTASSNLPISADIDPAQTDDDYPSKQFGVLLYTGNANTGQSLTGLGFKPDLIWCKMRSSSQNNQLFDSSRMNTRATPTPFGLRSDTNGAQFDDQSTGNNNPIIASFDTDGFSLGTSGSGPNDSGRTYVAWCWRANGGTTATNNDGNVTTTIQANPNAGFSIIKWTGTGTNSRTLGTGLTKQAEFVIVKRYNTTGTWIVYHHNAKDGGQPNDYGILQLNNTNAYSEGSGALTYWDISEWSDSVFSVGGDSQINGSGDSMLAYAWHSVEGYSKFGSFEGNSNADGPFVYTGFRPRLVFCKSADASENWQVRDTARSTFNADSQVRIYWNSSSAEGSASTASPIDFLSNGFKVRGSNSEINSNTIVYGAWGDVPFKYNNTF